MQFDLATEFLRILEAKCMILFQANFKAHPPPCWIAFFKVPSNVWVEGGANGDQNHIKDISEVQDFQPHPFNHWGACVAIKPEMFI